MLYSRFLLLDQTLLFHWFHFWPSKRGRFWHPCRRLCSNRTRIRFASQRRSFTQTVRTVICKWSNQICVSRHRQPVRMGCCGNDIIDCVHRWGGFPTCKHEKWRSIIAPAKRSQCRNPNSRIDPAQLPRCTSVTLDRKSLLLCPGAGDSKNPVRSAVRVRTETQPTKSDWNLFSNHLQMYLRCANVAFHVRFCFLFFFFCCLNILNENQLTTVLWALLINQKWGFEADEILLLHSSAPTYIQENIIVVKKVLLSPSTSKSGIKFGEHLWKVRFEVWKKIPMCIAGWNTEEEMCFLQIKPAYTVHLSFVGYFHDKAQSRIARTAV